MPVSSPSRVSPKLSRKHTNPFIVVLETTAAANTERVGTEAAQDPTARTSPPPATKHHLGKGSPEPAGLEPACRGEPDDQERTWEGSLRWGCGVTQSLEGDLVGWKGASVIVGLEDPDLGPERISPSSALPQSLVRMSQRPPTAGPLRDTPYSGKLLQWQRDILVPGKLLPTP